MFIGMGCVHLVAFLVLAVFGKPEDSMIALSQLVGGLLELSIGLYAYYKHGKVI